MNASLLQSLIDQKSSHIQSLEVLAKSFFEYSAYFAEQGRCIRAEESLIEASRLRRKLAKAVAQQRQLKAELAHVRREARIERKRAKLMPVNAVAAGYGTNGSTHGHTMTSYEVEACLDFWIVQHFPPKADSRKESA